MDALLQLRSLLALAAMIAAAWSVGRPIARRLGLLPEGDTTVLDLDTHRKNRGK